MTVLLKHIHTSVTTLKFFKMAKPVLRSATSFIKKKKKKKAYLKTYCIN
jgi:hypothetical protein